MVYHPTTCIRFDQCDQIVLQVLFHSQSWQYRLNQPSLPTLNQKSNQLADKFQGFEQHSPAGGHA